MVHGSQAVTNQSEPWTDVNLLGAHHALQDALRLHGERADDPALTALGAQAGGEGLMARVYRKMPFNSTWEGAGHIRARPRLLHAVRTGLHLST